MTRRYEFLRAGGLIQVLRNVFKTGKKQGEKRVKMSECYVTQYGREGGLKVLFLALRNC